MFVDTKSCVNQKGSLVVLHLQRQIVADTLLPSMLSQVIYVMGNMVKQHDHRQAKDSKYNHILSFDMYSPLISKWCRIDFTSQMIEMASYQTYVGKGWHRSASHYLCL